MKKKGIAFSEDGYYIVEVSDEEVRFRKARELDILYYLSFISLVPIVLAYAVTFYTWILLLILLPFILYLGYIKVALSRFSPSETCKLYSIEVKRNIVKIHSEAKTFIMQKGKLLSFKLDV